jgi:hypothetical protein
MNRLRSLVTPPMAALLALTLLVTPMVASSTELPPPAFHAFRQMDQSTVTTVTPLTDAELATIEGGQVAELLIQGLLIFGVTALALEALAGLSGGEAPMDVK